MKKQSLLLATKAIVLCLSLGVFSVANTVQAADTSSSKAPRFSYTGSKEDMISFEVNYFNPEGKSFLLEVRDESGEVLYKQAFEDKTFSKKIFILGSKEKLGVKFTIRSGKTSFSEAFDINPETRVVDDYIVRRL